MARVLVIDDEAVAKVEKVLEYAQGHIYEPDTGDPIPGGNPNFVTQLNTYRCVFTFTKVKEYPDKLVRHLSISIPSETLYPNPIAVSAIAGLFGFTGAERGIEQRIRDGAWGADTNKEDHCITVAEEIGGQKDHD
jgi:hypothetical protein